MRLKKRNEDTEDLEWLDSEKEVTSDTSDEQVCPSALSRAILSNNMLAEVSSLS